MRTGQAVDITRSHGDVKVVVTGGGVQLGGVNGSATVQVGRSMRDPYACATVVVCSISLITMYAQTVDGPLDVRFEALAPGTSNTLTTRRGTVGLLMVSLFVHNTCRSWTGMWDCCAVCSVNR